MIALVRRVMREAMSWLLGMKRFSGDQHLVTGIQDRLEDREEAVLRAVADDDLLRGIGQPVIPLHLAGDRHAQLHRAGDGRIAREAHFHGFLRRLADMLWGGKVRLARAETDHVQAGRGHLLGPGVDLQGQGGCDVQATVGNRQRHGKASLHNPIGNGSL